MIRTYIDILYCSHCDKDTKQEVYETGHERDASQDRFKCLECNYTKYGLSGEYELYEDDEDEQTG